MCRSQCNSPVETLFCKALAYMCHFKCDSLVKTGQSSDAKALKILILLPWITYLDP